MKRTTSTIIFAALMLAALVSCKKEDDSKESSNTTTSGNSTGINPLSVKACTGKGEIEVDNQKDTLMALEAVMPPLNLYGIYCDANSGSLSMQSGDKKLPPASKTFKVKGDPNTLPGSSEMILSYYDEKTELDYYAISGTVFYTISTSEKTVKFSNITFKSEDNKTKTISFEVKLR